MAAMVALARLKTAVVPLKVTVEMTVPFCRSDTEVMPTDGTPISVRVRLPRVTLLLPGLVSWICCTVTPALPGFWVESIGGVGPWEACTVTTVEVAVGVTVEVGVMVAVLVKVWVGVKLLVLVGVPEGVKVGVLVALLAKVLVVVAVVLEVGLAVAVEVAV